MRDILQQYINDSGRSHAFHEFLPHRHRQEEFQRTGKHIGAKHNDSVHSASTSDKAIRQSISKSDYAIRHSEACSDCGSDFRSSLLDKQSEDIKKILQTVKKIVLISGLFCYCPRLDVSLQRERVPFQIISDGRKYLQE
jgi:hypothetical protein